MRQSYLLPLALLVLVSPGCERAPGPQEVTRALCGDVDPEAQTRCLAKVATEATTFEACGRLPPSTLRAGCEKRFALEDKSADKCAKVVFLGERDACRVALAVDSDDLELCRQVTLPRPRRHCLVGIAKARKDATVCGEIPTAFEREQCIAQTVKDKSDCKSLKHPLVRARCEGPAPKPPAGAPAPH